MKNRVSHRILAAVLCFSLLVPNFAGLVTLTSAAEAQRVQTNSKWVPVSDPFAAGKIPAYQTSAGTVSAEALAYDCGNGLTRDGAKSYMKLVKQTNLNEVTVFDQTLRKSGFTRTSYSSAVADEAGNTNVFYRYLSPRKDYLVTVYYLNYYKEARIIVDTAEDMVNSFSGGFVYQSETNEVAQPMFTMYGLSMSPNGYDNTSKSAYRTGARNCGALMVIRMPDNSLFINDGGDIEQWSDEVCDDFMQFCRELTGKTAGEKVVINSWFLSHAHTDHFDGIPRFFERYHDSIDIKNVMYNIDDERLGTTRDISAVMNMIGGYFPDAKYYKMHTGDRFDIAGIRFDVLYTQEDRFVHNSENKMVIDIRDGDETNVNENRDGTYREFLYATGKVVNLSDFNDTSTVLKVTFSESLTKTKETSAILYGDVNLADQVLMDIWPDSTLKTDIMLVPHHGHDAHPELVALSGAKIFLYTQAKSAIYGPNGIADEDVDLAGTYRPALVQNFLAMHDSNGQKYFDTTATRKTYWEGTETACILFGDNTTFEHMPSGLTRDSEDPAGFTVYTMDAPYFEYGGWQSVSSVFASGSVNTTTNTATGNVKATLVTTNSDKTDNNTLVEGAFYAIVHNKSNRVMSYNAVVYDESLGIVHPEVAKSFVIGSQSSGSPVYFDSANGNVIHFSHDQRNALLWELDFTQFDGEEMPYNASRPRLGGVSEEYYHRSMFLKGIQSSAAPFWNLTQSNASSAFRVMQHISKYVFRTPTKALNEGSNGSDISYNIRVEFFADNTCVIFYHDNTNQNDFRVLTVDEAGNWVRRDYDNANEVVKDLDSLKLRLYRYETDSGNRKLTVTGNSLYKVLKNTAKDQVAADIINNLTVTDSTGLQVSCSGTTAKTGYYWLDMGGYNGVSNCSVTVKYRNDNGTDTPLATLTVEMQDYFSMLTEYNDDDTVYAGTRYGSEYGFLYLDEGVIYEEVVNHSNRMDMTVTIHDAVNGVVSSTVNITPDMLTYNNGAAVNLNVPGEYTNLSVNYNGQVIGTGFNIRVAATAQELSYPTYADPGSVTVNKQGLTPVKDFLKTGVANIQLSATGVPLDKGVDLIIVMDLSGSMKNGLNTNEDAPNYEDSRIVALQHSLQAIIDGMQAANSDVRVAMSDFGDLDHYYFDGSVVSKSILHQAFYDVGMDNVLNKGYEFYNHLNWVLSDGDQEAGAYGITTKKYNLGHCSYTGPVIPEIYTGSGTVNAGAFVDVNSLDDATMNGIIAKLDHNINKSIGTNYDIGLEYAYQLGYAIKQDNIAKGIDRELVCIFMSDGAAMQYNYFAGNSQSTTWNEYLLGVPDELNSTVDYFANYSNWPAEIEQISKVLLTKLTTKYVDNTYTSDFSSLLTPTYRSKCSTEYFTYVPGSTRASARYFFTYMDDQGYDIYDWDFLYRIAVANGLEDQIRQKFTPDYYHNKDNVLQYLVDLLTTPRGDNYITYKTNPDGSFVYETDANGNQVKVIESYQSLLKNPDYRDLGRDSVQSDPDKAIVAEYKYYALSNWTIDDSKPYTEQFFAAMKAIGVECDWALYALLAETNKTAIRDALGLTNGRDVLRQLIEKMKTPVAGYGDYQTLSPYDYFYNNEGKNWWAEAMKGDTDKLYPVINKYAHEDNAAWGADAYYGTVRNNFNTGTGLKLDGKDYISGYKGLGMDLYSVSFAISDDEQLVSETAETVLRNVSSGLSYFYAASTEDELINALSVILSTMSTAATRGWYTDTMGPDFKLSTSKTVLSHDGTVVTVNANPSVRVMEYDVEQYTDASGVVSYRRVGTPRIIETVTFEDIDGDGDVDAWSDQVYTTSEVGGVVVHEKVDIWDENTGLISAKNFYYNANVDQSISINFNGQGTYPLQPESFFWIIGAIGQTEMVLDYQVYLTGSIEGERFLTDSDYYHATNTNAVLHYVNYLGQNCTQDTVSPKYPWGDARVGVGFYLVNENGQMIADQNTGATTTDFSKAVKLTRPVYDYLVWNDANTVASGSVQAGLRRPEGYSLYSPNASYQVGLNFNGSGSWSVSDSTATTYVVSNEGTFNTSKSFAADSYNTGSTVVWFAVVVYNPVTMPDAVVIDYGLPVDINVLGNDMMFGTKGTLAALGSYSEDTAFSGIILKSGYTVNPYQGTYGTATIEKNKIHYVPSSMEMDGVEKINYAVYYTPRAGEDTSYRGYHYNTVTIIPATSIYYEDSFAQYQTYVYNSSKFQYVVTDENKWTQVNDEKHDAFQGAHQDEDRPGSWIPNDFDADNIYGYDSAYATCSKYSLGSSMKFTADANYAGTVTFSFYGTGFDVVSLTNSDTGTIMVDVYQAEGYVQDKSMPIHSYSVDTYYGYTYDASTDKWVVTPNSDTLYQVPVMKVVGLEYGHYTAVITVAYADFFDHNKSDASYEFYMDAVRIYDPVQNDPTADDAYTEDGEYAPVYEELRNLLLTERDFFDSTADLGEGFIPGAVFIDGIPTLDKDHYDTSFRKEPPEIGTYLNYGPNNEVYLAPGHAIAFQLNGMDALKAAHMAMKSTGGTAKIKVFSASLNVADVPMTEIATATDRYFDLTKLVGNTVIIANVGTASDGILSITNIKLTTDANAAEPVQASQVFTMSRRSADRALTALTDAVELPAPPVAPEIPGTSDVNVELMTCLMLLCGLSMAALVILVYMDRRVANRRRAR